MATRPGLLHTCYYMCEIVYVWNPVLQHDSSMYMYDRILYYNTACNVRVLYFIVTLYTHVL